MVNSPVICGVDKWLAMFNRNFFLFGDENTVFFKSSIAINQLFNSIECSQYECSRLKGLSILKKKEKSLKDY